MYRLAVCEDERDLREELCVLCREILTRLDVEHEITPFSSAEELSAALDGGARFDLLCLDILMSGRSGMELARELRERDEQTSILFVTGSTEFLLEGYGVRPIQYLLKPVKREELENAIRTDLRLNHRPQTVTLNVKGRTTVLPLSDIRYVESRNHGCVFHADGERFFALSLTQAESLLPKAQFCRCHNSFLVNMAQIRDVSAREVCLADGSRLTIGRRYSEQFQLEFVRYLNRNG